MYAEEPVFVFLRSIVKKMHSIADKELHPLGMSHAEMRLLMMIYQTDPDPCSQEDLAAKLVVDRSNVGRALKKLEHLGFIQRAKDLQDGRAYRVFLTKRGRTIRERLFKVKSSIEGTCMMGTTEKDREVLAGLLERMDQSLCEENYRILKDSE